MRGHRDTVAVDESLKTATRDRVTFDDDFNEISRVPEQYMPAHAWRVENRGGQGVGVHNDHGLDLLALLNGDAGDGSDSGFALIKANASDGVVKYELPLSSAAYGRIRAAIAKGDLPAIGRL